ncbi:TIGR03773 family transporter-associated surface protein [Glycomyces harbinensis]|uniref:Putative ABC transporter-associated repeat protein n=1 Tax=Glycomyces harbinensis TaxID=58114 RepID=A0A1G7AP34_9ACTN|nr:TIGR03773 family transporter-associated surface protein [Glycomyces harbinensis]SDE16227.1 putative ABC transporter-associated repeat protein [Glycomyces harbinensis]
MRHRTPLTAAASAALALGLWAAPAEAQAPEGIAAFETDGGTLAVTAPSELATLPALVPEREDFAFLGDAGDLVWVAGTVDGTTYPTLDASAADGDLTLGLDKVEGPGDAWLYTFTGPGLARPLASTADGDTFDLAAGTTAVVVLAVDEPGDYTIELRARQDASGHGSTPTGHAQTAAATAVTTYALTAEETTTEEAALIAADPAGDGNAQAAASCEVIADGHIDVGPRFVDGEWTVQLRDDRASESVWRDLEDVVLQVPDTALFPIPEGDYGFLGEPGQEIYMLPQVQAPGIVWPGWNTQDASVIEAVPGPVDWNLQAVDGPGAFTLFLTGTFGGAEVLFDSSQTLPQTIAVPENTHAHGNFTFAEAGVYRLTAEFTATTADGETVSDTKDLQLAVGDATDPNEACSGDGSGSGDSDDVGKDDDGGFLPTTGTGWLLWGLGAAAIAVVVGAVIMAATRKRRSTEDADAS